ncbi:MAG: creatininase family protein [Burkholderiales bacterium]|nr:creatininase family protein [Burkholderiales bacterium]
MKRPADNSPGRVPARTFMEMRAPEIAALARRTEVALIFVTQTAQAGPHLPVGSRYYLATEIGRRIVERLAAEDCEAVVGAVLPYGHSVFNACFPGVIHLTPATLAAVITEVGLSLARQGFRRLVILSNAGGNPPSVRFAIDNLSEREDIHVHFLDIQRARQQAARGLLEGAYPQHDSHAGEWETSCLLAIVPELVDMSKARCWFWDERDERHRLELEGLAFHDRQLALGAKDDRGWVGPAGNVGDSTKATAAKGEQILDNYARLFAEHIRKWVFKAPARGRRKPRARRRGGRGR